MSSRSDRRSYLIVTGAYWVDTLTDGALRMLVLFYFAQLGYTPFETALLFVGYELFGVLTNLFGGWLATRCGLRLTLLLGLATQLTALSLLAFAPPTLLIVPYVMAAQALSGVAKDLTKLASKSAVKLVAGDAAGQLYRWVSLLTGSKNAMKGVGFFVGALLLGLVGFQAALAGFAALVLTALLLSLRLLRSELGEAKQRPAWRSLFSANRAVNLLAAARIFLFAARDVWFVVGLPVFFISVLGWDFWQAGGFMALWTIGYGAVQAATPALLRHMTGGTAPDGRTALRLAFALALPLPAIVAALISGVAPATAVVGGLLLFGVLFALNSAVHSYLILAYSDDGKTAQQVGFYYMANALGRLSGTVLSGALYQAGTAAWGSVGGLAACLLAATLFVLLAGMLARLLPHGSGVRVTLSDAALGGE